MQMINTDSQMFRRLRDAFSPPSDGALISRNQVIALAFFALSIRLAYVLALVLLDGLINNGSDSGKYLLRAGNLLDHGALVYLDQGVLIPDTGRMRVGLVWAGRPTHGNDRNRSVSLELFLPLLRQTSVDFYALQVGDRVSDIATAGLQNDLIDLSPRLSDFAETAAALEQLDLLISVDTAVVHVAGALGRPVWALIPFAPDWRWGLETDKSPWYPSITLIRQETPGDWAPVIERIDAALGKKARRR